MTAGTGDEALDLASGSPPALVLLDLILPGIDGYTVCRELRQRSKAPIIVVSGRAGGTACAPSSSAPMPA